MNVNEFLDAYMQPTFAGMRAVAQVEATPPEIASVVAFLASASVEFTFDPLPDDRYEITVKIDQRLRLSDALTGSPYDDGSYEQRNPDSAIVGYYYGEHDDCPITVGHFHDCI